MTDFAKKKEFLERMEPYKQKLACEKCEGSETEVEFGSLKVTFGEGARKSPGNRDFTLIICSKCKRMLVFEALLKESEPVEAQEGMANEPQSKKSQCGICGHKRSRTLYSGFPGVARGHTPGAYEISVCENCGAAYFFEKQINFGIWGGVRIIVKLNRLAAAFKCGNCGQPHASASRTYFGKSVLGLFFAGAFVFSVRCKNCKYVQFYWDRD